MKILFDQGTPVPLRAVLRAYDVTTAFECGWQELSNGDLISAAERAGYDVLVTTDKNLKYQQNLSGRRLAVVVLPTTSWKKIQANAAVVAEAISVLASGAYVEVTFPA
jgi:hypothetical protein